LTNLKTHLQQLSDFLGDHTWFAGANVTFADFTMYDLLAQLKLWTPSSFTHQNLNDYLLRFEALPRIAAYMKSDRATLWPLFLPIAPWGGKNMPNPLKKQ